MSRTEVSLNNLWKKCSAAHHNITEGEEANITLINGRWVNRAMGAYDLGGTLTEAKAKIRWFWN